MAQGDITKEIEYDKIEVVSTWNIQVRQATKIMEEQADGSKKELTRSFHRHTLVPFQSEKIKCLKFNYSLDDVGIDDFIQTNC